MRAQDVAHGGDDRRERRVTPIRELDGRTIGAGQRGPITGQIQSLFFDVVNGRAPKYHHWLTQV